MKNFTGKWLYRSAYMMAGILGWIIENVLGWVMLRTYKIEYETDAQIRSRLEHDYTPGYVSKNRMEAVRHGISLADYQPDPRDDEDEE